MEDPREQVMGNAQDQPERGQTLSRRSSDPSIRWQVMRDLTPELADGT